MQRGEFLVKNMFGFPPPGFCILVEYKTDSVSKL